MRRSIYLDQAATSFPKPGVVTDSLQKFLQAHIGNPGRASHHMARTAADMVFECRTLAARHFDASPSHIIFTCNTTQALNMAIKGLLPSAHPKNQASIPHVLCSDMEHNAVYRPLASLQSQGLITLDTFDTLTLSPHSTPSAIIQSISRKCRPETAMLICTHASNICSASLPIKEIGDFCHEHSIIFVVDGAQSAGHLPLRVNEYHIQALCVPGHKGLFSPMGVGMLILGDGVMPRPILEGGNGVDSLLSHMGDELPERLEAGTLPTLGIVGLKAGLGYIEEVGLTNIASHEKRLGGMLTDALLDMPHVHVYAPHHRGSVVLFSVDGMTSEDVGEALDKQRICVRAGFHCCALGHRTLQTPAHGAVRASLGYLNTKKDVSALVDAVGRMGIR